MDNTTSVAFPEVPLEGETAKIPLRARDGSVRAYAIVDAADAEWANQWRWSLSTHGYAVRVTYLEGRYLTVMLHRELLGLTRGDGLEGDHIDRDRLNNRRANLRAVPAGANQQNKGSQRGATSTHRGVTRDGNKWRAQVMRRGKIAYLGLYSTEEEAAEAARVGRLRLLPYTVETAVAP